MTRPALSIILCCLALVLAACATTSGKDGSDSKKSGAAQADISGQTETGYLSQKDKSLPEKRTRRKKRHDKKDQNAETQDNGSKEPPRVDLAYAVLPAWYASDHRPALKAFQRSCMRWLKAPDDKPVHAKLPEYGSIGDWRDVCQEAHVLPASDRQAVRQYFERNFLPVHLQHHGGNTGLLTAYYQPEIDVRRVADAEFSEPILTLPADAEKRRLPRSKISAKTAPVIADGRLIDVFFMQIQGSGVLAFPDGQRLRAAYAGNNGHAYASIGRVLLRSGELMPGKASKQDIEAWMRRAGPARAKALADENARYIWFRAETIKPDEGPTGAFQVPLTAMGSLAVDPREHAYGVPIWLNVNLPKKAGDYNGSSAGLLVIAQDTGSAIVGPMRGDIYFGSGDEAGARAGVMKHQGKWYTLLPRALAERLLPQA